MEILADELETNTMVRVNSIDPGPVRTSLRKSAYPAEDPSIHPIPADIMLSYLYLMGPDSKSFTGQAFTVPQKLPE